MSGIEILWRSPLAGHVGRVLMHFIWQGAAAAVVLAACLARLRRAQARYALSCAVLLVMLLLPVITFFATTTSNASATIDTAALARSLPPAGDDPLFPNAEPASYLGVVTFAWLAGVLVFSIRLFGGWVMVARFVRQAAPSVDWQQTADAIARRLRSPKAVRVYESLRISTAVSLGWLRPVIILPIQVIAGLSREETEAILAHEIAHIVRRDYLVNVAQLLAETVLFYHPAVWWVSRKIREEREICSDDVVVNAFSNRAVYASALLRLEEARSSHALGLAASGGDLRRRIDRILGYRSVPRTPANAAAAATVTAAALLMCAAGLALAHGSPRVMPQTATSAASQERAPSGGPCVTIPVWKKWVNEDVVYIITKPERDHYAKLKTEGACEEFVQQFWDRRNPVPGSRDNDFKMEHYRRIAYANEHFATGVPGWRTDRGRIYIIYGPPDEIESHPGVSEKWKYRHIADVGEGVIIEFTGPEMRMTKDPHPEKGRMVKPK